MTDKCPGCHYPEPADWCWEQRLRCPLKYPPRNIDSRQLLGYLNQLEDRIEKLESPD
jgi:hypothetical protein